MAELQTAHRKSNLVFSARFPVVNDVPGSVAKSAYFPAPACSAYKQRPIIEQRNRKMLNSG